MTIRDLILAPAILAIWAIDSALRRSGLKEGMRYSSWCWRRWWRFGYSGPYQFGWLYKRRGLRARDVLIPHLLVWKALR